MGLHKLLREKGPKMLSVVKTNSSALGSPIWGAPYFIWLLFFFLARVTCSEYQPSQSAVEAIMAIFQRESRLGQFCKLQEINSSLITHLAFRVDAYCCCCSVDHPCPNLHDPWTVARRASLSLTISWSLPTFTSIASVMLSSHLNF